MSLDYQEFLEISNELQVHHGVFNVLWKLGKPNFSDKIDTACVEFDQIGSCINFLINETYYKSISRDQLLFTIAHECLHVMFYHGLRIDRNQMEISNIAADIVVNHYLVNKFSFDRTKCDPKNRFCWVDTIFDPKLNISDNETFEYYFNLLKSPENLAGGSLPSSGEKSSLEGFGNSQTSEDSKDSGKRYDQLGKGSLVDNHNSLKDFLNSSFEEVLDETISDNQDSFENIKDIIQKELESVEKEIKSRGLVGGNNLIIVKLNKVPKKKKWETVIKKWSLKHIKDRQKEQWARLNRRFTCLSTEFMLPSNQEIEDKENDKICVWFFQDTSGSCSGFAERFFKAASSLPKDKFDVKMHCFDTRVFETTLESGKLYGFGGTSFTCIENYIQSYCKKHNKKYPSAIFCITDGYGDYVYPEKPKNWHWFLSGNYTACIPKESKIYMLKDFE